MSFKSRTKGFILDPWRPIRWAFVLLFGETVALLIYSQKGSYEDTFGWTIVKAISGHWRRDEMSVVDAFFSSPLVWVASVIFFGWLLFRVFAWATSEEQKLVPTNSQKIMFAEVGGNAQPTISNNVMKVAQPVSQPSSLNGTDIKNKSIKLADILISSNPVIEDKSFVNCTIEGGGAVAFFQCPTIFDSSSNEFVFKSPTDILLVPKGTKIRYLIVFNNCSFSKCRFEKLQPIVCSDEAHLFSDMGFGIPVT